MTEDIHINLDTINKYYYNYGIDNTLEISINSLINKLGNTLYNYKTITILNAIIFIELLLNNMIELQTIYTIISKKTNFMVYLQKNVKYLKKRKNYNSLQMVVNNEQALEEIYNTIKKTAFITNIKKITTEKYKKNTFYNKKIKQLDKEMKQLIDKYNKFNQTKDNLYLCTNQEKVYIKVNPFWKIINKNTILFD